MYRILKLNESAKLEESNTNKIVKDFVHLPQEDFYGAENTIGNLNDGRVFVVFDDGTIAVSNDNLATLRKKIYDLENESAFDNYEDLTDSKLRKQILVEIGRDNYYVESAKLEEKDTVQDYIDFCNDMKIEPKNRASIDKYMNVFSRMYAQYNGLANLKAAKQKVESELKQYLTESNIQGLEDYSEDQIKAYAKDYIKQALIDSDVNLDDFKLVDMNIYGSRGRGTARDDSDLDIVFEYEGNLREDDLFNLLNDEDPLVINNIKVDFNPINSEKSGDMKSFMNRSKEYDKEKLKESQDTHQILSKVFSQYPDISEEDEDYLNSLSYEELISELKNRGWNKVLTEAEDLNDEETQEDQEKVEDIEDNQEEILDSEEDQEENPVEEESTLDKQLDELRDILVDLDDIRLYKIVSKDNEEFYILGKVANDSNDVEMLVDTQPIDYKNKEDSKETQEEINPEEINQKYQFVSLPLKFDSIKDMNPKYGEDLNPNHEELVSYLMNLLIEQNPEAAEERKEEEIEEPEDKELSEVPEEINSEEEDEDEEV